MGSVLRKDKIGALSESGGTLTLGPSILTIGGRQFQTSTLNLALPVLTANTRYQIYAVLNAGNVELNVSQNENSQGPSGFDSWKLVGCFFANGNILSSIGFGAFVNITGKPSSDAIAFDVVIEGATTDPTLSSAPVTNRADYRIDGERIHINWAYRHNSPNQGTAGSGVYTMKMPENMVADAAKMHTALAASQSTGCLGTCNVRDNATDGVGAAQYYFNPGVNESIGFNLGAEGTGTTALMSHVHFSFGSVDLRFGVDCKVPVVGFTNTAIEDR